MWTMFPLNQFSSRGSVRKILIWRFAKFSVSIHIICRHAKSCFKKIKIIFFGPKEVEKTKQIFWRKLTVLKQTSSDNTSSSLHFGYLKHFPSTYCVYESSVIRCLQILQERFVRRSLLVLKYSLSARSFLIKSWRISKFIYDK